MNTTWVFTASSTPAVKSGCTWTDGQNVLTMGTFPISAFGCEVRKLYLQRSKTHNVVIPVPGIPPVRNSLDGLLPSPNSLAEPDLGWSIIKSWNETDIPNSGVFPIVYSETVPHSTFYYYRLSLVFRKHLLQQNGQPYVPNIGNQWDSNIATIVQTFDLSICETDACTIPSGCSTPRVVWDAPELGIPIINAISHIPCCAPCGLACYRIDFSWPYASNIPTSYLVYKSYDGVTFSNQATALTSPWYDSDPANKIYYRFVAVLQSFSTAAGNTVVGTY